MATLKKIAVISKVKVENAILVVISAVCGVLLLTVFGAMVVSGSGMASFVTSKTCVDTNETSNMATSSMPIYVASKNPRWFDPIIKSITKNLPYGAKYEDKCLIDVKEIRSDGRVVWRSTPIASCSTADEDGVNKRNCRLQEGFCTGMSVGNYSYKCPLGCDDGACIATVQGKLTITKNPQPIDGNVVLGTKKFLYGSWNFNTIGSGEDVKITEITFSNQIATTTNIDSLSLYDVTNLTNCSAKYPGAVLDSYGCLLAVKDSYLGTTTWTLTDSIIIAKSDDLNLELRADVRSTASLYVGHMDEFVIRNDGIIIPVMAVGLGTDNVIIPDGDGYNATDGADITIVGGGILTINAGVWQYQSRLLAENQTYNFSRFKLIAANEAIRVKNLNICVNDGGIGALRGGNSDDISSIKIYKSTDELTPIIEGLIISTCESFSLADGVLDIPVGVDNINLIIKATTAKVDNPYIDESGSSNASFRVGINSADDIAGKGLISGLSVTKNYISGPKSAMVLHKSYPNVIINMLTNKLFSGATLFDLFIVNPTAAPIAIYKLSFNTGNGGVGDVMVNVGGLEAKLPSWPGFKKIAPDVKSSSTPAIFDFVFWDPDNIYLEKALVINPGDTAQFKFIGQIISGLDGIADEYIITTLLGDSVNINIPGQVASKLNANFIWSDLWLNDGPRLNNYPQWFNGYLVDGLLSTSTPVVVPE